MELGWGASSELSTTLSLKPSQTRFPFVIANWSSSTVMVNAWIFHLQNCWSMHDFFHLWNCDIAHNFSFEKLLVRVSFFFHFSNYWSMGFFFPFAKFFWIWIWQKKIHCWWRIHDFFSYYQKLLVNAWFIFYFFSIVELWYRTQPVDNKKDLLMYLSKLSYKDSYWIYWGHTQIPRYLLFGLDDKCFICSLCPNRKTKYSY